MIERNYWLTTTEMPILDGERPLPEVVDVAVIGAGFTGTFCGAHAGEARCESGRAGKRRPSDGERVRATGVWCSPG